MEVVVVVAEDHHHLGRAAQAGPGADEHVLGAGAHEPVDQLLGQPPVDLADLAGDLLLTVPARVVDVDVEAVLVGAVAVAAELGAEAAALRPAQVADDQAGGAGVGGGVLPGDPQPHPDQHPVGSDGRRLDVEQLHPLATAPLVDGDGAH